MIGRCASLPSGKWQWVGWDLLPEGDDSPACRFAPLPNGRGHDDESFSGVRRVCFSSQSLIEDGLGFSPLGETGEGFVLKAGKMSEPCQLRTSSQVKRSLKKNFNAQK